MLRFTADSGAASWVVLVFEVPAAALGAAALPNLMHAAFCLVLALLGLASFFFLLGAEFVGRVVEQVWPDDA